MQPHTEAASLFFRFQNHHKIRLLSASDSAAIFVHKEIPRLPISGEIRVVTPIPVRKGGVPFGFILSFLYKNSTYSSKNQYKK